MKFETLETFADALAAKFKLPGSAWPEDQLKPVVATLFEDTGAEYGFKVETRTEAQPHDQKIRPDIAIYVNGLVCG